jgi:AraC-like DNA-binding protein
MNGSGRVDVAHLWRAEVFGGLDVLRARIARFRFAPHAHEEFMIFVAESGTGQPHFWGQPQRVWPGDIFILSPGEAHEGGPAAGAVLGYRTFYPSAALMQRVMQEVTGIDREIPQFPQAVIRDPALANTLLHAHTALEEPHSALENESLLWEALARLVARFAVGGVMPGHIGSEHHAVTVVRDYLEALPAENVSLETLAREADISPYRLCRVFRRETGMPPHAYQILVRARYAKSLLMNGMSVAQAAVEAGFFDQAHLTRHFKRIYGVTPGRYSA